MKKKFSGMRKSSLFLIELLIAILFLALCSAVCIRFFVSARVLGKESYNQTQSVTTAQNIAEVFESCVGDIPTSGPTVLAAQLAGFFSYAVADGSTVRIYYDHTFQPCPPQNCIFIADIAFSFSPHLVSADIHILKAADQTPIYSLVTAQAVSASEARQSGSPSVRKEVKR